MILEYIVPILSLTISLIAVLFTAKKQKREIDNIDADTIAKLYDTIEKQGKRYDEMLEKQEARYNSLKCEFDTYKATMDLQFQNLQKESTKLRAWAGRLSRQLRDNNIQPEPFIKN